MLFSPFFQVLIDFYHRYGQTTLFSMFQKYKSV